MATESSPFEEEQSLEDELDEELLMLLALAFLSATSTIVISQFTFNNFSTVQERFKAEASSILPSLQSVSSRSIEVGLNRTASDLNLKDLHIDYSDSRIMNIVREAFSDNLEMILQTNQEMFSELLRIADERGWDNQEIARRLKMYYGLTPRFLKTVISMEDALKAEGLSKKVIQERVQKRIDQLVEHRIKLASTLIGTKVVEGSKDIAFTQLVETGQVDFDKYVKEWRSGVADGTTQVCLSSHRMIAEIGGVFANGFSAPPATDPVHPCRSSIRIVKRKS